MMKIPNPDKAFSVACGCGAPAGDPCPHTPIRCPHLWWYGDLTQPPPLDTALPPSTFAAGMTRECRYCGRQEKSEVTWATVRA